MKRNQKKKFKYHVTVQASFPRQSKKKTMMIFFNWQFTIKHTCLIYCHHPSFLSLHLLSPFSASVLELPSSEAGPCEPSQWQRNSPRLDRCCSLFCWGSTASNGLFSGLFDLRSTLRLPWGPGLGLETKVGQVLGSGGSPDYLQELRQWGRLQETGQGVPCSYVPLAK